MPRLEDRDTRRPRIAKLKRVHAKHIGAKAPSRYPLAGGRNDKFKKKIGGRTVLRNPAIDETLQGEKP